MNNVATVNYVYKNYEKFIKYFRKQPRNRVEDAISKVTINLIKRDTYQVEDVHTFAYQCIRNELFNIRKYDDRFVTLDNEWDYWDLQEAPENKTVDSEQKMSQIIWAMPELTKGQKEAVNNFLEYGNHTSSGNNSNTEKGQYRNAVARLKEIIK